MELKQLLKTNQKYLSILSDNLIHSIEDFFLYFPRDYENRTQIKSINEILIDGTIQIVKGEIISKNIIKTPTGKKIIEFILEDEFQNKCYLHFINKVFLLSQIKLNNYYIIIGKPKFEKGKIGFWHPEIQLSEENGANISYNIGNIYPIYSEMNGIKSNWFSKKNIGK